MKEREREREREREFENECKTKGLCSYGKHGQASSYPGQWNKGEYEGKYGVHAHA